MSRNKKQRRRRNIGNKARRKLPNLVNSNDHKCFWCKKPIAVLRCTPRDKIITMDHGSFTYKDGEGNVEVLIASVDHRIGLVDGGTNDLENLVPSCRYCNEDRGRKREAEIYEPVSRRCAKNTTKRR